MSLELLEKFLIEVVPPEAQNPVHKLFTQMKNDPLPVVVKGFNLLADDMKAGGELGAHAVNGILLGIALYYGAQRSPALEKILLGFIEHNTKGKSGNVISFASARIGVKP